MTRTQPEGDAGRDDERLESLIAECLKLLDSQGPAAVDEVCRRHPELADSLRARLDGLHRVGMTPGGRHPGGRRPGEQRVGEPGPAAPPEAIGPYRIVDTLGSGGMGTVYLAEQTGALERRVAIKVIKRGMDTDQVVARFEAERQALALLSHPGIAKVFEAGSTGDDRPFFVMELVDGESVTAFGDRHRLTIPARLRLFLQICDAVQHAHQNGIVHRDLKPSNILVGGPREQPEVKVIDFGLAKATQTRLTERTLYTEAGMILGTPEYMSPEQARSGDEGIDTRTDVYSLGVVLYELVSGCAPFDFQELRRAGLLELQRAILEDEAPRASTRISQLGELAAEHARRRGLGSAGELKRRVRGDLDWIAHRAIAKDREQRYASVSELAADVRRHLSDEPVLAGPPSTVYAVRKFVRRHRVGVAATATIFALLVGGLITVGWSLRQAQSNLEMFDSLANGDELEALLDRERREMLPARPDSETQLTAWIDQARGLVARLGRLREQHELLRAQHGEAVTADDGEVTWTFDLPRFRKLDEFLSGFVPGLAAFGGPDGKLGEVEKRLEWARGLAARTLGAHTAAWREAIEAIADQDRFPRYRGLRIREQVGLIPIGADPESGLWEFAFDLPGGALPQGDDASRIVVADDTTIVLVLVPGGTFDMGSDDIKEVESSVLPGVELEPFFVGKFEVTQGQWRLMTGENPSHHVPGREIPGHEEPIDATHPVERVDWTSAHYVLSTWGLRLPTEAQWEYAARADTTTAWWTGDDWRKIEGAANLGDETARSVIGGNVEGAYATWEDGFVVHAPVGRFRANGFGLHDVIGNVWEWCLDRYCLRYADATPRAGDGMLESEKDPNRRPIRGGSWKGGYQRAKSAFRLGNSIATQLPTFGVRAARAIDW